MIHVVTVITEDYVGRARCFLQSLANLTDVKRWCICLGFEPGREAADFAHVEFRSMPVPVDEVSFGMLQHGRWLDALPPSDNGDVYVLSDADCIVQRDFTEVERARLTSYDDMTVGAGINADPADNLIREGNRIGLAGLDSDMRSVPVYNCGFLAARAAAWEKICDAYVPQCQNFYARSNHRSRCQWLMCLCFNQLGLKVDILPPDLTAHGHVIDGIEHKLVFDDPRADASSIAFRHNLWPHAKRLDLLCQVQRYPGSDGPPYGGPGNKWNRVDGLLDLVRYAQPKSVVEVGCHQGVSTEVWLLHCSKVVAVDTWKNAYYFRQFCGLLDKYPMLVHRGDSVQAAQHYHDWQFDMVYLDADHSYECVKADIAAWLPKTSKWIAGHDWSFPGVRQAVLERLGEPMLFSDSSWLIRTNPALPDTHEAPSR